MVKLAVWGASGHALVVADIVRRMGSHQIVGFIDDLDPTPRAVLPETTGVLGGQEQLDVLRATGVRHLIVAIGDCEARLRLADVARMRGFRLATAVHPRAIVADDVVLGEGSVVCAGAVVNPGCWLGDNVIVNTLASVDHECRLEDGVHISPGAHLGGGVVVGRGAWVGIGAAVKPNVTIGAGSILGAGAVLLRDLPEAVVAYGVPAAIRKERTRNDQQD
jgi:UDP-N-acetylbacillosamine N-acetyltransferase